MSEDKNNEPAKRMRNIMAKSDEDSPLSRLPKAKTTDLPTAPLSARKPPQQPPAVPPRPPVNTQASTPADNGKSKSPYKNLKFGPPFWTIASLLSMTVNIILIAVLLILLRYLGFLQSTANDVGAGLVGGLFVNFEKMDAATIRTNIPVDAQIPLDITVPVQTTTQITLAEQASIPNAHVRINTGGLDIDSAANVTLPAGTPLMVTLNFNLPVKASIPVHLDVPVDIPLANTELHEPFVGLQNVIKPLFCIVEPNALRLDGQTLVCK